MKRKIGRNEPCPCGSGEKYKRCCEGRAPVDFGLPEDLKTGTFLDDYFALFQMIALYGNMLTTRKDADGKQLKREHKDFEKRFRPGAPGSVPDSLHMGWTYLDLRFGSSGETVCERFITSQLLKNLVEPGPLLVRQLSRSYCGFYEVKEILNDRLLLEELCTGTEWSMRCTDEAIDCCASVGDVWYVRLVGEPDECYHFMTPQIFPHESKEDFERTMQARKEVVREFQAGNGASEEDLFRECCKASVPYWAEYLVHAPVDEASPPADNATTLPRMPEMQNTDGEPLRFCKSYYSITQKEGLAEKLSSVRNFDFDDRNRMWIWSTKGNRRFKSWPSTSLGSLSIHESHVVAETNSVARALKLKNKRLRGGFSRHLSYERIEVRDFETLPPPSKEEQERFEREQQELMSNPEVREALRQQAEDYYHHDWMTQKIPVLGSRTPPQAAKTRKGREQLEALLAGLERDQKARGDEPYQVDVDGLRRKLGLTEH